MQATYICKFEFYVLPCASSSSDAPRNSELLNILHDAQSTLASTGRTVQKQGQQIDSACVNMNKIHNDLSVAETLIYNLDAWLSKWNLEIHQVHIDVPEDSILIEKAEYSVVYARTSKEKHFPGTLVLSKKSLKIFDAGRSLDISFAVKMTISSSLGSYSTNS